MTTSGTYAFAPQIDDLLTEAWERLNLSASQITADVARSARRSLQAMQIDWTNRPGLNLWQVERWNATANAGDTLITGPAATVDVLELWIAGTDGLELLLSPVGRDEWAGIPNKALTGRPTQYWVERRTDTPVIHLWPVPDQSYALAINRLRQPQDVSAMAQTPDAPILWTEALYAGLAARLAQKFAPAKFGELKGLAEEAYANAAGENRERTPFTLLPTVEW